MPSPLDKQLNLYLSLVRWMMPPPLMESLCSNLVRWMPLPTLRRSSPYLNLSLVPLPQSAVMDASTNCQTLVPLPQSAVMDASTSRKESTQPMQLPFGSGVNISFCFYQK